MTFRLLFAVISLFGSSLASAQTERDTTPKRMLEFLEPGMRIGLSSVEGTMSVTLRSYTESDYVIAQDLAAKIGSSIKSATFVAKTNPAVSKVLEEYVARLALTPEEKDRLMITTHTRTSFGTVTSVGDDYVLLEMNDEQESKRVIPASSIGALYLDASPVRFLHHPTRSQAAVGG